MIASIHANTAKAVEPLSKLSTREEVGPRLCGGLHKTCDRYGSSASCYTPFRSVCIGEWLRCPSFWT